MEEITHKFINSLAMLIALFLVTHIFVGCSPSLKTCQNITIEKNITVEVVKEIPANCPACPECKPTIQTVTQTIYDEQCEASRTALQHAYIECALNVSQLQSEVDGSCIDQLTHCNETLGNYEARLNNISWYASANR